MHFNYIIVGAGLAGITLAERIATQLHKSVLIIEKRDHIAGNVYDEYDDAGILVQRYGPHTFHTNDREVFNYVCQYCDYWHEYQHRVLSYVDGHFVPMPISLETINQLYNLNLSEDQMEAFIESKRVKMDEADIKTSEDVCLSQCGQDLYEKFFKYFTIKQWGVDPSQLDKSVISRIPFRKNRDTRYFTDKYQGNPKGGFTQMCRRMLAHPEIKVLLNTDYKEVLPLNEDNNINNNGNINSNGNADGDNGNADSGLLNNALNETDGNKTFSLSRHNDADVAFNESNGNVGSLLTYDRLIYTGPLDYYFDYKLGKLKWRSVKFIFETHDCESYQPVASTRWPMDYDYTRITEFKKMTGQKSDKTTILKEIPYDPPHDSHSHHDNNDIGGDVGRDDVAEPLYTFPTKEWKELAERYRELAREEERNKGVIFLGRLAEYKYYDMDDVIRRALDIFKNIIVKDNSNG